MNRWKKIRCGARSNRVPLLPGEWRPEPEGTKWTKEDRRKLVVTLVVTAIITATVLVLWQVLVVNPHDKFMMDTYGQIDQRDLWSVDITDRDWDD